MYLSYLRTSAIGVPLSLCPSVPAPARPCHSPNLLERDNKVAPPPPSTDDEPLLGCDGPSAETDVESCSYMLRGVSGGAQIYYDDPKLPNGEFQRCYTYATIQGYRRVASLSS